MSQTTSRAKQFLLPLIEGKWPKLSEFDKAHLAAWAVLFTIVIEYAHPETVTVPIHERVAFKASRIPPDNWFVFYGKYTGVETDGRFWHRAAGSKPPDGVPRRPNLQSTTFCIGKVVFHTVRIPAGAVFDYLGISQILGLSVLWPATAAHDGIPAFDDAGVGGIVYAFWEMMGAPIDQETIAYARSQRVWG